VILLLRESQGAGLLGYGPLLLLPVLWLLLYGSRREAGYAIAGIAVTLIASAELDGGGASLTDLRLVIVWTAVASTVCVAVLRLVAEVRRQAAELERLASTDSLTGLPNRRVWEDALPRELARSQRAGTPVAIALLDLDHFKTYNDHNGHQGGDLLLKEAAAAWPVELRESDLLARHGDEEFALLLPDCGTADAADVVEKVRRATPAEATSSAGVAVWNGIETADQLIRRAGEALSEAKRSGRDRTVVAHGGGPRPEPAGA
jgi:diguanylate cyclase (GGDEF)-like protein